MKYVRRDSLVSVRNLEEDETYHSWEGPRRTAKAGSVEVTYPLGQKQYYPRELFQREFIALEEVDSDG